MNVKKTIAATGCGILAAPAIFAEGETLTVDTQKAEEAVGAVGDAISGLISGAITTNLLTILGAALVITFIFLAVSWLIKGGKKGAK